MAEVSGITLGNDTDDCRWRNNETFSLTRFEIGDNGYQVQSCAARFLGVNVPKNSTVSSAVVSMRSNANNSGTTCRIRIKGETSATPATFSTIGDYEGRGRTTAYVDWEPESFTAYDWFDTPNIATVLQEIFALAGWSSGNNLVVFMEDNGSDSGARRQMNDYGDSSSYAATLAITYTEPTGVIHRLMTCGAGQA